MLDDTATYGLPKRGCSKVRQTQRNHKERHHRSIMATGKKGAARVETPILPPLNIALQNIKVVGSTYLLTSRGKSFLSGDALGQRFRKWCLAANLNNHSAHGVRKATGHLLASLGCTQYEIMSIHGHTEAGTSEIYTKGVERWNLALSAMDKLNTLEW